MLGELRRRVVEDVARVDLGGRDLERLGAVLLGQRDVGVVDELEGVFVVLVELVGERALCEKCDRSVGPNRDRIGDQLKVMLVLQSIALPLSYGPFQRLDR